ncbi:cache domain-containing protein [Bosea sp. ASV33]|uniref:cache domain-containing protein n=1 Tax=Bosea sp. ASV33 TaxID=2795106 RepID=UPI0018EC3E52|nr:cache domain-containing protein [Bosea sp. ASV33]
MPSSFAQRLLGAGLPALLLACILGAMLWHQHRSVEQVAARSREEQMRLVGTLLGASFDQAAKSSLSLAESFARNADIRDALAAEDRIRLQALSQDAYQYLSRQANVQIFGFHDRELRYLLRMHRPDQHGDDISAFRAMIVAANRLRRAQTGIEIGIAGIGIRGVALVQRGSEFFGTMEVGLDIRPLIELVKTATNSEIAVVAAASLTGVALDPKLPSIGGLSIMASTDDQLFLNLLRAQGTQPQRDIEFGRRRIGERNYAFMSQPLVDFSGKLVGTVLMLKEEPRSDWSRLSTELWVIALCGGILAFVGFLVLSRPRRAVS